MGSDNPFKHVTAAFLSAVIIYIVAYSFIEHRRVRKGPWQVTFTFDSTSRDPCILINQPALELTNVEISFAHEQALLTNPAITAVYGQPQPVPFDVPFGKCVFMDTTFLPGTLTLRLFGHEIELLPRTLIIDHTEQPWRASPPYSLKSIMSSNAPAKP